MPEMNQEFLKKLMSGQYNPQSESTPAASEAKTETSPPVTSVPTSIGQDASLEQIPISSLTDFPDNPVPPYTDDGLAELIESIRVNGVIEPLIVRPFGDGWQIINGRNRRNAAQRIGYSTVPCVVKRLSDDDAVIQLIETIFKQRDVSKLSLMQKARAYRLLMDARSRQGFRSDLTSRQVGEKLLSVDQLSDNSNDSARQIHRYIRLTYLISELQDRVDLGKPDFSFNAAVLVSLLSEDNQTTAYRFFLDENNYGISIKLAELLREKERSGIVFDDNMLSVLWDSLNGQPTEEIDTEEFDGEEPENVVFNYKKFKEYLPPRCSTEKMEQIIVKALKLYNRIENRKGSKR